MTSPSPTAQRRSLKRCRCDRSPFPGSVVPRAHARGHRADPALRGQVRRAGFDPVRDPELNFLQRVDEGEAVAAHAERVARIEDRVHVPPGNRLEALTGDREGQHSIRVNDQYRVCFRWTPGGAEDVEIVDYH